MSSANGDKSKSYKYILFTLSIDMDMFLDGGDLDFEDQDILEDQYISDFNMDENKKHDVNN